MLCRCQCACRDEELAAVAKIQAEAFFEASPIAPLDPLLYYIFQVWLISKTQAVPLACHRLLLKRM